MWALASLAAFVGAVAGHASIRRALPRIGSLSGFVLVGCFLGAGLAVFLVHESRFTLETGAGLASYAFACELYIFLFGSVSSSISASILHQLRSSRLSSGDIEDRFGGTAMVQRRLANLVSAGVLETTAEGYRHTVVGTRLLRAYRGFRSFFRRTGPVAHAAHGQQKDPPGLH
jgi:hypothetical protein